jgi:uncharacterized protein
MMKMRKQLFGALLILLLCAAMAVPAFALSDMPRLVDNAGLLTDSEKSELLDKLDEISERQQADIVVVTTDSLDGKTPAAYAADFYDNNGYGFGTDRDGVLLLVSMEDQDWHLSTSGYGMTAITDDGIEYISDKFLPHLSDGDYAAALTAYAGLCDEFITQAKKGQPYDGGHMPKAPFKAVRNLLISMAIGLAAAFVVTGSMKAKLKSVRMQSAAASYVRSNSMNITESREMLLYQTTDRREKPKSGKSASGSSSHISSSGQTHGGGGGKF